MRWKNKIIIGFGILFSVFFVGFSSSACYAIDDFEVVINSSHYPTASWNRPCGSGSNNDFNNSEPCSSYRYALYYENNCSFNFSIRMGSVNSTGFVGSLVPYVFFDSLGSLPSADFTLYSNSWSSINSTCEIHYGVYVNNPLNAPSGSLSITENGTYDVTNYSEAVVDVPPEVIQGDYHQDLVNIYHAILVCGGVCLVLYFFYSIYRLLIKSTGGWR